MSKTRCFRVYKYSQKALWVVPSAYSPIGESACALATHTYQNITYSIYLSRLSVCPSKGFSKASATDDFDLIILRLVYILIILLPDTFLNLLKEYFISSVLFHLSKLIKQLLFGTIILSQNSKGSCFMNKLYNKEMDIAIGLNDFFSQMLNLF